MNIVGGADIISGYRSDHSIITLDLKPSGLQKGRTFWKYNTSLLHDFTHIQDVNNIIDDTIEQYAIPVYNREKLQELPKDQIYFTISDDLFLETLLMNIRGKTISYATAKKKKSMEEESQLEKDISCLENK